MGRKFLFLNYVDTPDEASKARVEREMRAMGLLARRPKRFRVTTDSAHALPVAGNTLDRKFDATEPNRA